MPSDKKRLIRLQTLDRCFSDQMRHYYIEDLIRKCEEALRAAGMEDAGVSRRTIYEDIKYMEFGNPEWSFLFKEPAKDGRKRYYQYEDPNYSIFKNDLNETELSQLKSTLLFLNQFNGMPQYETLQNLIAELEEKYHFHLKDSETYIDFDTNDLLQGLDWMADICAAIESKKALTITYKPFGKNAYTQVAHPYYIKEYNNRWFLMAWIVTPKFSGLTNFALDRIKAIEPSPVEYILNTIDFEDFFYDQIGVSHDDRVAVEEIVLKFSEKRVNYVVSKPLHGSQNNHRKDEGIISIKVRPNRELYQKLLSYGPDVEVLSPESVRQEMQHRVEEMMKKYESVQ